MKAIGLKQYLPIDDPASLIDFEADTPTPAGRDLLVRVHAIAVNPVDTKVRAPKGDGKVEDPPRILGWDASGVVEAVRPDATLFKPGDEVYYAGDITRPGCNAELQLVDERIVGPKPASLSHAQAAALPLTTITAYEAFFDRLKIDRDGGNAGESILIVGGAGGVGSIGIQLAKIAKLRVIATASRPESVAWCKTLGADDIINHREPLRPQVEALGLRHVDHLALFNDTDGHWSAATDLIRPQGTIVSIVENAKPLAMGEMKRKSASLAWEFMFARSMFQTPDMAEQHKLLKWAAQQVDAGKIQTTLSKVMSPINAANLRRAHAELEAGFATGKIVLEGF
ncbi:MAG: zinc-binding alcohol dehydrogenase family protein [Planctomycetota bacterium]